MTFQKYLFVHISVFRYLVVGLLNSILTLTVIYLAKWSISLGDINANMLGYRLGLIFSLFVNKHWTFSYDGSIQSIILKFLLVFAIAYLVNLMVVLVSINYLKFNSYISHALGIPPYTVIGYLGNRFFVFRKNKLL